MPVSSTSLIDVLSKLNEITITVTGRKSGRAISIPVWFVLEGDTLLLLPVKGSKTEWYQNLVKNPTISIEAGRAKGEFKAVPVAEAAQVKSVVEKFRHKYGAGDVKKYYSTFDVAVIVAMK